MFSSASTPQMGKAGANCSKARFASRRDCTYHGRRKFRHERTSALLRLRYRSGSSNASRCRKRSEVWDILDRSGMPSAQGGRLAQPTYVRTDRTPGLGRAEGVGWVTVSRFCAPGQTLAIAPDLSLKRHL
jgi:hypothetical protein